MMTVLLKTIVSRFYERNAGFFFFVFFLMFGIVESSQLLNYHLSLMTGMIKAPVFLLLVLMVWLAYLLKCMGFVLNRLDLPENEFLYHINLNDSRNQLKSIVAVVFLVDLPVIAYGIVVVGLALRSGNFIAAAEIVIFHLIGVYAVSWIVRRKINNRHITAWSLNLPEIRWPGPRPFPFFYVNHLTGQLKTVLWVTKGFSILAIVGFFQIPPDGYDPRIGLLGLLFGLMAHSVVVFEFRRFEDQYLTFTRNLPQSLPSRFLSMTLVYLIVLVPEAVILIINHTHLIDTAGIMAYAVGFLMFLHCNQYSGALDMEKHTPRILGLFLISFMLVLTKVYLAEAVVLWSVSFIVYRKNYYNFEGAKG